MHPTWSLEKVHFDDIIADMKPGKYMNYKNKPYEVIGVARHSETLEELVVYRALYDSEEFDTNSLWVRPKKMFMEDVEVDGVSVPRFKLSEPRFVGF